VIDTASLKVVKSIPVNGRLHNVYVTAGNKFVVTGSVRRTAQKKRTRFGSFIICCGKGSYRMSYGLRLCNRIRIKSDLGLCQESAVRRCAGYHRNVCFGQNDSLKVRTRLKGHSIGNLPEDVVGLGAADQQNVHVGGNTESSRYLKDPDVIRAA